MACRINASTMLTRTKLVVINTSAGASDSAEKSSTVPHVPETRSGVSQSLSVSVARSLAVGESPAQAGTEIPTVSSTINQPMDRLALNIPAFDLVEHSMKLSFEIGPR